MRPNFHQDFKLKGNKFKTLNALKFYASTLSKELHAFIEEWFNEESYVEVKTSGSTGVPKVIKLQKSHMINSAQATCEFFNLRKNTSALLCMSSNFIAGKMMLIRALELGWDLDVVEPVSTPLKESKKHYNFCAMVPIQLHNSLDQLNRIETLIVGGGVVSSELLEKIQTVETNIFATYGMTETITHIAVKKLNNFSDAKLNKKSHYQTLPDVEISVDDRNCLVINAPNISNEVVVTNDIVNLISSTQFEWLGRFDTIINSGGVKLIPEQIESKLAAFISNRFFVTGVPDSVFGEKLILIVEDTCNHRDDLMQRLKELKLLLKYELPKEIHFIEAFVETETKKINRKESLKLLQQS